MSWTAGADVSTGDLMTAAQWNSYLGAGGDIDILKAQTDRLDDFSHSQPARALNTIYENTSGKILFFNVTVQCADTETVYLEIQNATPPTLDIARIYHESQADDIRITLFAIVPLTFYYRARILSGSPTLIEWNEWLL